MIEFLKKIAQPIVLVAALAYIFLHRNCDNPVIPKGKEIIVYDTIYKPIQLPPKEIIKYITKEGKEILVQGRIDTIEVKVFEKAPDSVKTNMFVDCKTIKQYNQTFKDTLADVSIFAETEGRLLKLVPTVIIKARLPEKKTTFAMYAGGGLYLYKLNEMNYKLNLRFQNKRGDLFSGSYDPSTKTTFIDYDFRFINIKK